METQSLVWDGAFSGVGCSRRKRAMRSRLLLLLKKVIKREILVAVVVVVGNVDFRAM